jgi:hypothetical protein
MMQKQIFPILFGRATLMILLFFKKGKDPEKTFSLDTGFLEMHGALQEIAKWYEKWSALQNRQRKNNSKLLERENLRTTRQ